MADQTKDAVSSEAKQEQCLTEEQLEAEYKKGKSMIEIEPEEAAEILAKVLEAKVKTHGEFAEELAGPHLCYGRALLEHVRSSRDAVGSSKVRTKSINISTADDDTQKNTNKVVMADDTAGDVAGAHSDQADQATTTTGEQPEQQEKQDDESADKETKADADDDKEGDNDNEEEDDENDEGEEEDNEGDDVDDLQLAWDSLEMARLICLKHGEDKHALLLADVYLSLGDISAEKDNITDALADYAKCQALLDKQDPSPKRRLAEVHFQSMLCYIMSDNLRQALSHCQLAMQYIKERKAEIMVIMDTPVEGESEEAADAEIEKLERELETLDGTLADLKEQASELQTAIKEEGTLKDTVMSAFRSLAEAGNGTGAGSREQGNAAAQQPSTTAIGFGAAPAAQAGATENRPVVQNLGVAGRGRARITLQPCQPTVRPVQSQSSANPSSAAALPVKRTLADVVSGNGGATTIGFGNGTAHVDAVSKLDAIMAKRPRGDDLTTESATENTAPEISNQQ